MAPLLLAVLALVQAGERRPLPTSALEQYPTTARMLTVDKKLDNLSLSYRRVWRWYRSMARFGGEGTTAPMSPDHWVREGVSAKTLTLRGREVTLSDKPLDDFAGGINLQIWSNIGGQRRTVTYRGPGQDKLDASWVEIEPPTNDGHLPEGIVRMFWSFGVGYTPWITSVTSIEVQQLMTQVKGTMDFPKNGITLFTLVVDDDGLVRRAELVHRRAKQEEQRVVVTNTGKLQVGKLTFATLGEVRPKVSENVPRLRGCCVGDEEYTLEKVRIELTDEEYRHLSELVIPNNSYITDAQENARKYRNARGEEVFLGPLKPPGVSDARNSAFPYRAVIVIHGLLFLLAAGVWYWRFRRVKAI